MLNKLHFISVPLIMIILDEHLQSATGWKVTDAVYWLKLWANVWEWNVWQMELLVSSFALFENRLWFCVALQESWLSIWPPNVKPHHSETFERRSISALPLQSIQTLRPISCRPIVQSFCDTLWKSVATRIQSWGHRLKNWFRLHVRSVSVQNMLWIQHLMYRA